MGNCFGIEDIPMMTIGTKTVRRSQMKKIKTYQDALRFIGRDCPDTAVITTIFNTDVAFVPVTDSTPERATRFIADEAALWRPVIRATNIEID